MLYDQIQEAVRFIRRRTDFAPAFGLVLGTGLGSLAEQIEVTATFDYLDIPHFPLATAPAHKGQLILGTLSGAQVVTMAGRFHYYEGHAMQQVTFPIRVMKALGAQRLVLSSAVGGLNPDYEIGDLVFIRDHINLMPENPLRGPNDERLGPRFPDMLHTYDPEMADLAMSLAASHDIRAHRGVLAAVAGPNLETPAEYAFLHRIGADLAGMSVVPEVLVAKQAGMKIFAASVVTDFSYPPEAIRETSSADVIAAASGAAPKLTRIVEGLLSQFQNS